MGMGGMQKGGKHWGTTLIKEKIRNGSNVLDDEFMKTFNPKKIVYILDSKCVFGSGHSALLFVDGRGRGVYYNTAFIEDLVGAVRGKNVDYIYKRFILSRLDLEKFLTNGNLKRVKTGREIVSLFNFDKFIAFDVKDFRQGKAVLEKADQVYKNPGKYNLYERNCNHISMEILSCIGLNFSPVRGDAELVISDFFELMEKVRKLEITAAKAFVNKSYLQYMEIGIVPNASYYKKINQEGKKNYIYGELPIKCIRDLILHNSRHHDKCISKNPERKISFDLVEAKTPQEKQFSIA